MSEEDIKVIECVINIGKEIGEWINFNPIILEKLYNIYIKQQKEIEELKILKDDIQDKRIVYIDTPEFNDTYIAKQNIKDKIKKYNQRIAEMHPASDIVTIEDLEDKIKDLKELLEE